MILITTIKYLKFISTAVAGTVAFVLATPFITNDFLNKRILLTLNVQTQIVKRPSFMIYCLDGVNACVLAFESCDV